MNKYVIMRAIAFLCVFLTACTTPTDPSEMYKGETAEQIFQHAEDSLRNGSYSDAIKRFEALDVQYPYERHVEIAELHIIYAYYKNADYLSAEAAADRFIHSHPTNVHVDYAYLMRGLANYYQNMGVFEKVFSVDFSTRDLSQVKKSFSDFSELANRFPNSIYAPAAHQYMIYLRNVLAIHQLEVAQYYFNHKAYVAAANRASLVVKHYQGAPCVPDALVLMAKSYHALHLPQLENQTLQVLRYNYPNLNVESQATVVLPPQPQAEVHPQELRAQTVAAYTNGARGSNGVTLQNVADNMSHLAKSVPTPVPLPLPQKTMAVAQQQPAPIFPLNGTR